MSRGLDSSLVTQAESGHVRPIHFAKLGFDSSTMYLHNGVGSYAWSDPDDGSQTWLGLGDFGGITGLRESSQTSPFEIKLTLSGLDSSMMAEVLTQDYYQRPVTIYLGSLNISTGALRATPDEIWAGFMDSASVSLGEENAIIVTCESELAIFQRANGATFSDSDLQATYSGDLWFEWLPSMLNTISVWHGDSGFGAGPDLAPDPTRIYGPE